MAFLRGAPVRRLLGHVGRQPRGLFGIAEFCQGFNTRFDGYMLMLTDRYPPFSSFAEPGPTGLS